MQINPPLQGGLAYMCTWSLVLFPNRQGAQEYASKSAQGLELAFEKHANPRIAEHIYERHFLSSYLDWLTYNPSGNGPVASEYSQYIMLTASRTDCFC